MSMNKRYVTEIFKSITQPLRQSILMRKGLGAESLEMDLKVLSTPKVRFSEKKGECTDIWLLKKYEELKSLEEKNLEMFIGIQEIFSEPKFKELFSQSERELLETVCRFIEDCVKKQKRLSQENQAKEMAPIDRIEALYTIEYLKLQKQMVVLSKKLFVLAEIAADRVGPSMFTFGGLNGDILVTAAQRVNRMALLFREIMENMDEGSADEARLKKIYENATEVNLFADEMMPDAPKIASHINEDPFCLRELLCEEEIYQIMAGMINKKNKKKCQALEFLKDLSILIREGCFVTDGVENTCRVIDFALEHTSSHSREIRECIQAGNHIALIEVLIAKAEENIKVVGPVLTQFVTSKYFVERARLLPAAKETEEKYQYRLKQKILHGGECVELFSIAKEDGGKKKTWKKLGLEVLGLMTPFLVLAAIPVVGLPLSLAVFSILGLASFAYYMATENKENKQKQTVKDSSKQEQRMSKNKRMDVDDVVNTPGLTNRHHSISPENDQAMERRRQSSIVIGARKSLYRQERENRADTQTEKESIQNNHKKEMNGTYGAEVTEEISFRQRTETSVEAKAILGGGMWIAEDRKRRKMLASNDEVKMNNPVSGSDKESSKVSWFSDGNISCYESFPEIEEGSDVEEGDSLRFCTHGR